jgi:Activator of Hsp90 ATPase homolog 1-like protein
MDMLFDFVVDKAAKTVVITREFDAELALVWDAFTTQEILDQWVAPAPMVSRTKYMNFEVGGKRFYAMVSPEGTERWAIQRYTSICRRGRKSSIAGVGVGLPVQRRKRHYNGGGHYIQ